ncbi:hypothetical protein RRG43_01700 [Mycoplasmopsis cynos]|uniref:Uncharacterized protein n=1 Tax=Mycoplasmopsis cynos (strain C142) TaxID=1246955 RepID=L0RUZ5_MYCC1|nr:hypothetical protein [Mycoplasmopsis cynos]WQQ15783.1 hypothetical protein RRG43_01700 [Mycoplasmopsis cynos]CCP24468.1 Hypothetical protein MCYN_0736 [Mycoplasmopsis cynos C142]
MKLYTSSKDFWKKYFHFLVGANLGIQAYIIDVYIKLIVEKYKNIYFYKIFLSK